MKNKETLRFINGNIKGCKTKIALLSICQILLGVLTVAFSFMLKFIIESIQKDMGSTVIMATHDKDIVNRMKKRVIVIKDGLLDGDYLKGSYKVDENN